MTDAAVLAASTLDDAVAAWPADCAITGGVEVGQTVLKVPSV